MSYKVTVVNYCPYTIYAQGPEQRGAAHKPIVKLAPGEKMVTDYTGKVWVFMRGPANSCATHEARPTFIKGTFTVDKLGVHSATKCSPWKKPIFG